VDQDAVRLGYNLPNSRSVMLLSERYRVVREIGRGGMATVYLAEDLKHRRQVAVKVMKRSDEGGLDRDRFLREIEVAAHLNHPHIVPLFDSGAAGDDLYYVMPYVAGDTLRGRLARDGHLSIEDALRLGREIASALGHAHGLGLVHRDLKPENVLLAGDIPLVADFGVARALAAAADQRTHTGTTGGAIIGTPTYMSPEQACGEAIDQRSDVYSLGCVVFEMIAGRPPFLGSTAPEVIRQHLTEDPPALDSLRQETPSAVTHVIARALAKQPGERHATALQFAEALAAATAGAVTPAPAPRADHATPHNLPAERTQFIGRERELAACARLMGETRLLTMTAIGGCGKTRLALKLAEQLLASFPDGVWFVDLAPVSDGAHVVDAVASSVGVRESAGRNLAESIVDRLSGTQTLVILDNCEHVLEAARASADRLLQASGVCVVATSREALGLEGERLYSLRSLATPAPRSAGGADVETSESVRLFVDRARRVVADFELTAANVDAVAEICRRLDGIPLAIELAAARGKVLSVEQIRDRLGDALRLLSDGAKGAPGRHHTLEATIAWSHDQLTAEEQRLFHMLAVFSGGWSLDMLTKVTAASDEFLLLDQLTRLVDKSLVQVDRPRGLEPRYSLLETVRQFASARLASSGELGATRARHADECLSMAERAYAGRLADEDRWLATLTLEHDNLRSALEFFRATAPECQLQMAGAMAWFWVARSHLFEGRAQIASALSATAATPARPSRARALGGLAALQTWQGDGAAAAISSRESLVMWREIGNPSEIAMALDWAGWSYFVAGDDESAYATFKEMLTLENVNGDVHLRNRANVGVGQLAVALGHTGEARACAQEILRYVESHPNSRSEHLAYHYLADCALLSEQYRDSLALYQRSLGLALVLGDRVEIGFEIQGVAMSLAELAAPDTALRLVAAVEAEWARIGVNIGVRFWSALLDRHIGTSRSRVGDDAVRLRADGAALSFDSAVQLALNARHREQAW
jgi:predicted ATPase